MPATKPIDWNALATRLAARNADPVRREWAKGLRARHPHLFA